MAHPVGGLLRLLALEHRDLVLGARAAPVHKPWMRYREMDAIEEILRRQRPGRCLEWGAGASTCYFGSRLPPGARWIAIEHDREWADAVEARCPDPRIEVHHVAPNRPLVPDADEDAAAAALRDYVAYPTPFAPFDFILVDGRARVGCLRRARDLLAPQGVIVLHDADRPQYRPGFEGYPRQVLLRGRRENAGGLWIGSIALPIGDVLDIDDHQRLWRWCRRVGKVLRC